MDVLGSALAAAVTLIIRIACEAFNLILSIAGIFFFSAITISMLYIFAKSCDCCFTLLGGGDCAAIVIVFGFGVLFLFGLAVNSTRGLHRRHYPRMDLAAAFSRSAPASRAKRRACWPHIHHSRYCVGCPLSRARHAAARDGTGCIADLTPWNSSQAVAYSRRPSALGLPSRRTGHCFCSQGESKTAGVVRACRFSFTECLQCSSFAGHGYL